MNVKSVEIREIWGEGFTKALSKPLNKGFNSLSQYRNLWIFCSPTVFSNMNFHTQQPIAKQFWDTMKVCEPLYIYIPGPGSTGSPTLSHISTTERYMSMNENIWYRLCWIKEHVPILNYLPVLRQISREDGNMTYPDISRRFSNQVWHCICC